MNRANYSKGRAVALPVLGLLTGLAWSIPVVARTTDSPAAQTRAVDSAIPRPPLTLEGQIDLAEGLFQVGDGHLSAGREVEARDAFDSALDAFVNLKGPAAADPRFLPAYEGLINRIHAVEVAAGAQRRSLPGPITASRPQPDAQTPLAVPAEPPPENTLADLGNRIEAITPTADARLSNEAVLGTEVIDLPIELNDQVLGAIDLYSGKFRNWFSRALSRGVPHLPRIREILAAAGVPQDLAYVPIVESAFNPSALSRAKAKGLWQFIPSTGKQYGLKQDFFVDERSNMEMATAAAAQYLKRLYAMFGDWNLALAGYNAGEGTVKRAIRRANTNDFWALAKTRSFRSETKNYVPLIHAAIMIAKSPESYGIELLPAETTLVETVRVLGSYPITTVARCANTEPAEIRQMNPELRRGLTPSSAFDLKVPHGSAEGFSVCLASERAMNYTRHVVRKRDTLSLLSKMFGVSAAEIARVNGFALTSRLKPGTELAVPRPTTRAASSTTTLSADRRPSALDPEDSYTIRKGDTLSAVAARHSTTVDAIKALNGLSSSRLSIGQVLRVSSSTTSENNPPE